MSPVRWLLSNISTLLLALVLAIVVWISAVTAANPNVDQVRPVPLDIIGLDTDMVVVGKGFFVDGCGGEPVSWDWDTCNR